ncbi:MAG: putative toxin-antitoxin system toxin component, PIN family [Chloroflexi bacterium]|nr:putative toxin-antitoxin system toxin component, PIN family [Chloroflexota bacterium]
MAAKPRPRVFLDSNVIFSGLNSPAGPPGKILQLFTDSELTVVVSQYVVDEVVRNVNEKLPWAIPELRAILDSTESEMIESMLPAEVAHWRPYLRLGDATILAAAMAARPDYFVTGDRHFLDNPTLARESGLRIVSPAQFVELVDAP